MPILKLLKGRASQREFPIDSDHVTLGRDAGQAICLVHEKVSRKHAEIVRIDQDFYLIDCKSRNGTLLNGKRLEPSVCHPLANHDLIKICDYILEFVSGTTDPWRSLRQRTAPSAVEMVGEQRELDQTFISSHLDSSSKSWERRVATNPERKLRTMMELARNLHRSLELDDVLDRVLESLLRFFHQANRVVVVLVESDSDGQLVPRLVKHRAADELEAPLAISRSVISHVLGSRQAIISNDVKADPRFRASGSVEELTTRSLMCAPLLDLEGRSLGALQLESADPDAHFGADDLDLLVSVALQASLAIEDALLHETVLRERAMQRDLELAREIQLGLLPSEPPRVEGYNFYDFYAPATQIGGDYYDYLTLGADRLGVVLGDVSGKGIPAALLMAKLSSEMRVYLAGGYALSEVITRVNASFRERSPYGSFVTLLLLSLNTVTHEGILLNAGHLRPLLRTDGGRVVPLGQGQAGFPIGLASSQKHQPERFTLGPGDALVLFSDGVTDALDEHGRRYGPERLTRQIAGSDAPASVLGRRIVDDLLAHVGSAPQADDVCLVCLSRSEAEEDEASSGV